MSDRSEAHRHIIGSASHIDTDLNAVSLELEHRFQRNLAVFEAAAAGDFHFREHDPTAFGLSWFDSGVVDSAIVGVGRSTLGLSRVLKNAVSGHTQHYALFMAAGILALLALAVLAL